MFLRRIKPFIFIVSTLVNSVFVEGSVARSYGLIQDPADIKKLTTPTPSFKVYDNWTDWESWEPSADIAQDFPRYRSGYDLDGLVVHVIEIGVLDHRKWAAETEEKQEEFWKAYEWWTRREEKDAAFNNDQGIVLILDFDGFALKHSASPEALQADLKMFSIMFRQNTAVKYGFAINVNFSADSFLNLSKPLWGEFLSNFEFYGTRREKWIPKLLRRIAASQLPPKYGGSKDWKPLNFTEYEPLGLTGP